MYPTTAFANLDDFTSTHGPFRYLGIILSCRSPCIFNSRQRLLCSPVRHCCVCFRKRFYLRVSQVGYKLSFLPHEIQISHMVNSHSLDITFPTPVSTPRWRPALSLRDIRVCASSLLSSLSLLSLCTAPRLNFFIVLSLSLALARLPCCPFTACVLN